MKNVLSNWSAPWINFAWNFETEPFREVETLFILTIPTLPRKPFLVLNYSQKKWWTKEESFSKLSTVLLKGIKKLLNFSDERTSFETQLRNIQKEPNEVARIY